MKIASTTSIHAWLACVVLSFAASAHAAEDPSSLEAAKELYRVADFQKAVPLLHEAVQQLESLRDVEAARSRLVDAYLHLALSYCALGDPDAGKDAFRQLLVVDPSWRLDPAVYAPKVVDLFERARLSLPPEPAAVGLSEPALPPSRLPRDRWLTLELARQQSWLSSREPFAGLQDLTFDPASGTVDLNGRSSPDLPARNTQYVRIRLPWGLGDVTLERRGEVGGIFHDYQPAGVDPEVNLPLAASDGSTTLDSKSIVWSRPFWSGTPLWRRPLQYRWELGYRHVMVEESLYQDWWIPTVHRRGHRTTNSELRLHGGRAGLVAAVDLGRGLTIDLALGGTLFFAGHEDARQSVYLPASSEEGTTHSRYGLKAQGQIDARLQWDALRLRRGAVHVAVTAFHEFGGPAGSFQPNATIATHGISGVVGLDLGPNR